VTGLATSSQKDFTQRKRVRRGIEFFSNSEMQRYEVTQDGILLGDGVGNLVTKRLHTEIQS
jgi:uncharacterized protein (DUF1919 family)